MNYLAFIDLNRTLEDINNIATYVAIATPSYVPSEFLSLRYIRRK